MENTGEAIWKSFSEKGFVLAGIDGPEYQAFFQSLVRVSQTSRAGFRVLDGVENVQDGDYVLLFARPTIAEHLPSAQKKRSGAAARRRREAGKKENKDWSTPFEETGKTIRTREAGGRGLGGDTAASFSAAEPCKDKTGRSAFNFRK